MLPAINNEDVLTSTSYKKITSINYWNEYTRKISFFLEQNGITMKDCFLVGSGVDDKLISDIDDIDCAIILAYNYSDNELLLLREMLDKFILETDLYNKYHFRLFDSLGFKNLAEYDGYRLYEFQKDNLSFYGTNILFDSTPVLNSENFNMSYLIQLVYDSLMNKDIFEFREDNIKSKNRLIRNIEINASNGIVLNANGESDLKAEFDALRKKTTQSCCDWNIFLDKYFEKIKHEYINKSNKYNHNLKQYLCR
jgi:hypothetical protein